MSCKLISITNDAESITCWIARISNPVNQERGDNIDKLINYCINNGHWSVFEHGYLSIEITTSRYVSAQIIRHRSFKFQEFSQRYADPTADLGFVIRDARKQDLKNRQNSIPLTLGEANLQEQWAQRQREVIDAAKSAYSWAIENGIAKEQARCVLPEGNTESRIYMAGTLRSWIHYIQLRSANGTQLEHQEIALACAQVIAKIFPMAHELTGS